MENKIITFLSGKVRKGTVLSEKDKFAFQLISIAQLLRRMVVECVNIMLQWTKFKILNREFPFSLQ